MEPLKALNDIDSEEVDSVSRIIALRAAYVAAGERVDQLNTELAAQKDTVEKQLAEKNSLKTSLEVANTVKQQMSALLMNVLQGDDSFFEWFVGQCRETGALCQLKEWISSELDYVTTDDVRDVVHDVVEKLDIEVEVTRIST
jgi:predicted Zn-dependent peptidase